MPEERAKKYRLYVKHGECLGKGCRICEGHLTGFHELHGGDYEFSEWVLRDPASSEVIKNVITDCPAGCIGWDEKKNTEA